MGMRRRQVLIFTFALLSASTVYGGWGDWWRSRIVGTGHDAITTPGVAVNLGAKFERKLVSYFRPDMRGEAVDVAIAGMTLSATTDRDGVATAAVSAGAPGEWAFTARLRGEPNADTADARLFVYDPTWPVAVVDIDGTLSDMDAWRVPFEGHRAPTYAHCLQLIQDLARTHRIVYLTARDDAFDAVSREFLRRHGYPDGPVLYNDLGLTTMPELRQLISSNHGEFKLAVIQGLQARGLNVALGIGNAETDAFAYENAGIPSYIHTTEVGSGPSFRFDDYSLLRLELVANGTLP